MNWLWLNVPLATLIFGAVTGIPMWIVIKHPDTGKDAAARPVARPVSAAAASRGSQRPCRAPGAGQRAHQHCGLSAFVGVVPPAGHCLVPARRVFWSWGSSCYVPGTVLGVLDGAGGVPRGSGR